jgi:hypothetical protein
VTAQPEIDRFRTNLTTVFHQMKAAERESEQRLGELLFWEFEYREAMDNYKGEAAAAKSLRAELEEARAELSDRQATHRQNLGVTARAFDRVEAGDLSGARSALLAAGEGADRPSSASPRSGP